VIYFYYGENDFELKRQIDAATAKFATKFDADAVIKLDAGEIEPQNLLAEIVNINLFAPRRLVVVRGLDLNKAAWTLLGENLRRVPDEIELVVTASAPDKRTKTFKELMKVAKTREFTKIQGAALRKWASNEFAVAQVEAQNDAIDELIAATGGDQWRMAAEIAKFAAFGRKVNKKLVQEIVEPNLETNAFEILSLALAGRRAETAAEIAKLRQIEDANKFLGLLASQVFALVAAIHAGSGSDVAAKLKIHPFQLGKMRSLARTLGDAVEQKRRLRRASEILAETDAKMKLADAEKAWTLIAVGLGRL
jgi:DNA polymerase III delta subunit